MTEYKQDKNFRRAFGIVSGHSDCKSQLADAIRCKKIHHGWIFQGPRGIGKYRLAMQFAAALLTDSEANFSYSADSQIGHLIANQSHPDLRIMQRPFDDKGKQKAEIPVASAREISKFFSLRPAMGGWRVAIIDSLDEMNRNGENALLKTLEEPPADSILILIHHNENTLLQTIRSRCRVLKFQPLSDPEAVQALLSIDLSQKDAESILAICPGQPGKALELADPTAQQAALSAKVAMQSNTGLDTSTLSKLLMTSSKSNEAFWAAMQTIENMTKINALNEDDALKSAAWADLYSQLTQLRAESMTLNQDKSQTIAMAVMKYNQIVQMQERY